MTFRSILFENPEDGVAKEIPEAPAFFVDLNLDQIIDVITAGKQEYNLKPFFYTSLSDVETITYRHEIMRDLENPTLFEKIESFARRMRAMHEHLVQADKLHYKFQKERWFLDAVEIYCDAVNGLAHDLSLVALQARGFLAFRAYLTDYASSDRFTSLVIETQKLLADLSAVKYSLLINGTTIKVRKCDSDTDYSAEVEATFEKFKQGAAKDYRSSFPSRPEMNHVEAQVLDFVAQLYPETFSGLDAYCVKESDYLDQIIGAFDREVQFYIAYLRYIAVFKRAGLKFCYPRVSNRCKEVRDEEGFDLALAYKLITTNAPVICNDFYLKEPERVLVVSGPNQGGKTTFARSFGQLHYLASMGCPVPGREAQLLLFDRLFTHFEREEDLKNLHGKLQDDLVRIHDILVQATSNSIIIMNEIFTSTTLQDAIFLGRKVMGSIIQLDSLCVCVTFIDEMASLSEKTVSMVSTVSPENPTLRTFKILRKPADGLSYAISIAERYQLTYGRLRERIKA